MMLTFSGLALDRAASQRGDPLRIAQWLEDPTSQTLVASVAGVLLADGTPTYLLRRPARSYLGLGTEGELPIFLGLADGRALFAVDLDLLPSATLSRFTEGGRIVGLREAGAVISRQEAGLAAYLVALLNWHRRHHFCPNCGGGTVVSEAGLSRRCAGCGAMHFPRTDPVVIALVANGGRVLLGRNADWPRGRYSVISGFVAPGESLEDAVVREVEEESGIRVYDPTFVTSQPWPFPTSLMLGFEARSEGGTPNARDGELEDVRWFTRDAIALAIGGHTEDFCLPPPDSIAYFLVERWLRNQRLAQR
jgi:NAD+ diphosphatase